MKCRAVIFFLAAVCLPLCGCGTQTAEGGEKAAYARCAETSEYCMAETEQGFYRMSSGYLYYADKTDVSKWMPVCSKPNCTHDGNTEGCDAALGGRGFRLQNGRVYFYASYSFYGGDGGVALASISAGGGDRRLEKAISATLPGVGGQWRNCMSSVGDVLFCSGMNEAGTFDNVAVLVQDGEERVLARGNTEEINYSFLGTTTHAEHIGGDLAIAYLLNDGQEDEGTVLYHIGEEELKALGDTADLGLGVMQNWDMVGAYLQGTTFQAYLPNDGYYDVDLATGERVKTMDVRMADSWGWHLTEQYILESPLLKRQPESPPELGEGPHGMELYDGETWRPVKLPEELEQAQGTPELLPEALTSDRIFLTWPDNENKVSRLYQILLGDGDLEMTYISLFSW